MRWGSESLFPFLQKAGRTATPARPNSPLMVQIFSSN